MNVTHSEKVKPFLSTTRKFVQLGVGINRFKNEHIILDWYHSHISTTMDVFQILHPFQVMDLVNAPIQKNLRLIVRL